ncbi:hypothetical protein [Candidatus Lariskella endosymbiont of Epinotia ramella]|uniref:hypothetical protein n=1 Tax=Candidatus Lariskella endosymbiont of Epinotia ramella TaxID=3066224 RepID=UPI0030CCFFBA
MLSLIKSRILINLYGYARGLMTSPIEIKKSTESRTICYLPWQTARYLALY